VNLGALLIARNDPERAIAILTEAKLRVFEIYDAISCLNNLIIAHAMTRDFERAEEYFEEFLSTLKETKFDDPSFLVKPKINIAIVFSQMGDVQRADELLSQCELAPDHINYNILVSKKALIGRLGEKVGTWRGPENDIMHCSAYWPQILDFWDYNAPVIDAEFFRFLDDIRPILTAAGETRSEAPRRLPRRTGSHTPS
jgi:tetratricopeptide (TPR) repeat protein